MRKKTFTVYDTKTLSNNDRMHILVKISIKVIPKYLETVDQYIVKVGLKISPLTIKPFQNK